MESKLTLLPHGDRAVDIVFENSISPAVNAPLGHHSDRSPGEPKRSDQVGRFLYYLL